MKWFQEIRVAVLSVFFFSVVLSLESYAEPRKWQRTYGSTRSSVLESQSTKPSATTGSKDEYLGEQRTDSLAETLVEHDDTESKAQHSVDVQGHYRASRNGEPLGEGTIQYQSQSKKKIAHDGGDNALAVINSEQDSLADENEWAATALESLADNQAVAETKYLIKKSKLLEAGADELDLYMAKLSYLGYARLNELMAQVVQTKGSPDAKERWEEAHNLATEMESGIRHYILVLGSRGRGTEVPRYKSQLKIVTEIKGLLEDRKS